MSRRIDHERLVAQYRAGVPTRQIADEFGVPLGAIHDVLWRLRKAGHDIPKRSEVVRAERRAARRGELDEELVRRIEALLTAIDEGPRTARCAPARERAEELRRWLDGYSKSATS